MTNLPGRLTLSLLLAVSYLSAFSGLAVAETERPAHHANKNGFVNPHAQRQQGGFFGIVKARLSDDWRSYDAKRDIVPVTTAQPLPAGQASDNATVTWIGHATVLIQHQGINVLTDPMFAKYASPVSWAGPSRITEPALTIAQLPPIHAVVISHDHYDHLDVKSIRQLGDGPRYFVPLGIKRWLTGKGISASRVVEMDWWDTCTIPITNAPVINAPIINARDGISETAAEAVRLGDEPSCQPWPTAETALPMQPATLRITATPTQHFSGRGLTDRNRTLWASWGLAWPDFQAWFGGDTGYNNTQFKQIGERLGAIDLGIIPIGAYEPRWFMGTVHVNPAEAVKIHQDIGANASMGIHWGTFILAGEGVLTPISDLAAAVDDQQLQTDEFSVFAVGETRHYTAADTAQPPQQQTPTASNATGR